MKHLVGLNFISQVFCHSSSLSRSFWRSEVSLSDLEMKLQNAFGLSVIAVVRN